MSSNKRKLSALADLRTNYAKHIEIVQGAKVHPHQVPIFEAASKYSRVLVSSCHNLGKSWIAARIVLAELPSWPRSKCLTTAPTMGQVKDILWSEIRAGFRDSKMPLGGDMQTLAWRLAEDWFAKGMKPRDVAGTGSGQGTASAFQGFKAGEGGILRIIFEEATGILKQMWLQAEGMMTSANVKWLCIFNPTSKASPVYEAWLSPIWKKIKLTCFDSPNLITNGMLDLEDLLAEAEILRALNDEDRLTRIAGYKIAVDYFLTLQWVMERLLEWGPEHPLFQAKALGEFPDEDEMALMSLGKVEAAMYREADSLDSDPVFIGVDCARFGVDKSVITILMGDVVQKPIVKMKRRETEVAGEVMNLLKTTLKNRDVRCICVDSTGIGGGVLDMLIENQREGKIDSNIELREVHFGAGFKKEKGADDEVTPLSEEDQERYANVKAKAFVLLANALDEDKGGKLVLPNESVYSKELPTILYKFTRKGQYYMESKDEYKKRTGMGSPDHADSLALAVYARDQSAGVGYFGSGGGGSSDDETRYDSEGEKMQAEEYIPQSDGELNY